MKLKYLSPVLLLSLLVTGCSAVEYLFVEDVYEAPPSELTEFTPEFEPDVIWDNQAGDGADETGNELAAWWEEGKIFAVDHEGEVSAFNDYVILGGFTLVSQFNYLGSHSFSAMGSVISRNIPPYVLVSGHMAKPVGVNVEGLRRRQFTDNQIRNIRQAYKYLYRSGLRLEEAEQKLHSIQQESSELEILFSFLAKQEGGIIR